jgi:hypothetical protein
MNKKLLAVVGLIAIIAGVFVLQGRSTTKTHASSGAQPNQTLAMTQSPHATRAPEHVVYRVFFHHLMALRNQATEIERKGGDGRGLRSYYKNKARLTDAEALTLDQIAADCDREIASLDAKASKIIMAIRTRAQVSHSLSAGSVPPLPPELAAMQQQRNSIILRARQKLRTALGEEAFRQLDDFIKVDAERNAKPAELQPTTR